MADTFLYFPKCKITRADSMSDGTIAQCTLLIRSTQNTPSFYPQHPILKGKAEFFYKFDIYSQVFQWNNNYREIAQRFLGPKVFQTNAKSLLKKEVSVLARFNPEAEIKLKCIGLGLPEEDDMFFESAEPEDTRPLLKKTRLEYALGHNSQKKIVKRLKI